MVYWASLNAPPVRASCRNTAQVQNSTDLIKDLSRSEQTVLTPHRYGGRDISQCQSDQVRPGGLSTHRSARQHKTAATDSSSQTLLWCFQASLVDATVRPAAD